MQNIFKRSFILILTTLALIMNGIRVVPAHAAFGSVFGAGSRNIGVIHYDRKPLAAPVVNEPAGFTNDTTPTISGTAEGGSRVNVWYLDDLDSPVRICKDVLVDDDDRDTKNRDEEHESGNWSCTSGRVLPEREIELIVNATDNNGQTSADTTYFFTVDITAPDVPQITAPPPVTNDTTPTISGTAEGGSRVNVWYLNDFGSPVRICKDVHVDQSGNWSCTSSRILPEREIELVINATDAAGNTSADAFLHFTINTTLDTTPPMVSSLILASPNPTSSPSVNYTVTFSEPVVNVDPSDFALDFTGTISGATIDNVTGSGDTYTVTVNTGFLGDGSLRLEIPVTATINDLAGNPLSGLPYVSSEAYTIVREFEKDTIGVFRQNGSAWYLRNSNASGSPDISSDFGFPGDYPVVGDWDGNGTDTIGVYRNGVFYLSNSNTLSSADFVFAFGASGDQPVAGDWDGDGIDTVGLYRSAAATFYLSNSNSAGAPEMIFPYGVPGDVGISGDWNDDGVDTIGVYRPSNGNWFLKNTNATGVSDFAFDYGLIGDKPVVADWNNDGVDTVGVYRNGTFYLRNINTTGFGDLAFDFGLPGDMPVAGNWDGLP